MARGLQPKAAVNSREGEGEHLTRSPPFAQPPLGLPVNHEARASWLGSSQVSPPDGAQGARGRVSLISKGEEGRQRRPFMLFMYLCVITLLQ